MVPGLEDTAEPSAEPLRVTSHHFPSSWLTGLLSIPTKGQVLPCLQVFPQAGLSVWSALALTPQSMNKLLLILQRITEMSLPQKDSPRLLSPPSKLHSPQFSLITLPVTCLFSCLRLPLLLGSQFHGSKAGSDLKVHSEP